MSAVERGGLASAIVLGLVLAAAPLTVALDGSAIGHHVAFAKDGNGNGGGHGNGGANGNNGGHGNSGSDGNNDSGSNTHGKSASAGSNGQGGGLGKSKGRDSDLDGTDDSETTLASNQFGRLNGFLHASEQARLNAAPNSAVGEISKTYNDALKAYLEARTALATTPDDPNAPSTGTTQEDVDAALAEAAGALLNAANKPLDADVVAAINDELGAAATLTDAEKAEVAENIAEAADTLGAAPGAGITP